jgi:hypothetical protein
MNIINCKKLLYSLLVILLIMSIICYFVNMESFAGRIRRRRRRRRLRRINRISNASINAAINAQDVTLSVKAIQFVKKSTDGTFAINPFSVTTTDKEIIKYDINTQNDLITLDTNKYTFTTPQKIKEVSFINTSTKDISQTSINDVLKDVTMNFLDSSDTIINQILMPEQVETQFTFILPPYSQTYTSAQLYLQKIKNARAIANALINADKLTIAKTNARIINDSIANALKNVTDISLNITSIDNQKKAITAKIVELEKSLKVKKVRFTKTRTDIRNNYNDVVTSLTSVSGSNLESDIASFKLNYLMIKNETSYITNSNIELLGDARSPITAGDATSGVLLTSSSNLNDPNNIDINFINPQTITKIEFINGSEDKKKAQLTGVKMQFLDTQNNVLNEIILSGDTQSYSLEFPDRYTLGSALANTQSQINTNNANSKILQNKLTEELTKYSTAKLISEDTVTLEKKTKLLTEVYIQGYKAISSALEQVKTASKSLNNALDYDIYINDYVSTNYINLVEEQQKKMLNQALLYAKKARSAIFNLLDQTKLTLPKITLFGLAGTYSSTVTLSENETSYNGLTSATLPIVRHNFRLNMLIDIQDLAKNELTTLSSSIISADTLLKTLLNPPTK